MTSTLDEWEAEAKNYGYSWGKNLMELRDKERILTLIDLVRQKDEDLRFAIETLEQVEMFGGNDMIPTVQKALKKLNRDEEKETHPS